MYRLPHDGSPGEGVSTLPVIERVRHQVGRRRFYWRNRRDIRLLRCFAQKDRTLLDIGANKGYFTLAMRSHFAHFVAYEPNPDIFDILRDQVGSFATVYQCAVSDSPGCLTLRVPIIAAKLRHGLGTLGDVPTNATRVERHDVNVVTLDSHDHVRIGLIKIDVEGHELAVVRGAREIIARELPLIFVEINHQSMPERFAAVAGLLGESRYRPYFGAGNHLVGVREAIAPPASVSDFFFLSERHVERARQVGIAVR